MQGVSPELERHNIGLVAISYDLPETLRAFADARGIEYPLLSDRGSVVIERLGLLDRDLEAHHAHTSGCPPATTSVGWRTPRYSCSPRRDGWSRSGSRTTTGPGRVASSCSRRPSASGRRGRGLPLRRRSRGVRLRLSADGGGYARYQLTRVHVELEADDGWHVYGAPVPAGYTAFEVEVEAEDGVEVGPHEFPEPREFTVEGLDERFVVHEGRVDVVVPVAFNVGKERGPVPVRVTVGYQACSDTTCLPRRAPSSSSPCRRSWSHDASGYTAAWHEETCGMSTIRCVRLFADTAGESRFDEVEVSLAPTDFAPPVPPMDLSAPVPASQFVFLQVPPG